MLYDTRSMTSWRLIGAGESNQNIQNCMIHKVKKYTQVVLKHTLSWVSVPKETTYIVFYSGRCNIRQVVFQTQYIWGGFNLPIRKLGTWATTIKDFSNKNQFWTPSRFFTHHQNQRFLEKFAQNHRGDWWPWWTRLCSHTDWATITETL
jgi:hypothetical protein